MTAHDRRPRDIVCIIGPTGSGKNELALRLSEHFPLEIINFDSRQVYVDLPVITAQPSDGEKQVCPHHLYGFLGLRDRISAGRFVDRARQAIEKVCSRGRVPFLVGGTGMYLRSLVHGLAQMPQVPDSVQNELENTCRASGVEALYARLVAFDPVYARTITPRDRQKIVRALGVCLASGKPFSRWHREQDKRPLYNALKLGVMTGLEELTPKLRKRIGDMIRNGAVDEVRKAWEKSGHDHSCPAFTGIGCREVLGYILGQADLDETLNVWHKNTRAYAKRQLTWFRKEQELFPADPKVPAKSAQVISEFLER